MYVCMGVYWHGQLWSLEVAPPKNGHGQLWSLEVAPLKNWHGQLWSSEVAPLRNWPGQLWSLEVVPFCRRFWCTFNIYVAQSSKATLLTYTNQQSQGTNYFIKFSCKLQWGSE